jgi:1-deoxy-D-xylulose-5-phosphate synthase
VLNARFVKPLDVASVTALARRCRCLVTVEEHAGGGGFGAAVLEALEMAGVQVPVRRLAVPDRVIEHGDSKALLASFGLDAGGIAQAVLDLLGTERS